MTQEARETDFDVAVSFAGENRGFVEDVVQLIKEKGFEVFYDEDYKHDMWGEELTEYFPDIYENRARFAVMFISKDYASKPWTNLERRSVLLRAMNSNSPYLLPVRLDSTDLQGVRTSISYLDGLREGPSGVAEGILHKLNKPGSSGSRKFNGLVPRTEHEMTILLGERPPGWEYLLFGAFLIRSIDEHEKRYQDHKLEFSLPKTFVSTDEVQEIALRELSRLSATTKTFERLLLGPAQHEAMGPAGEDGDPDLIEQLATRLGLVYLEMLTWSDSLRAYHTPTTEGTEILFALSKYASQPIDEVRAFTRRYRNFADGITKMLETNERVENSFNISFEIPENVGDEYQRALDAFEQEHL